MANRTLRILGLADNSIGDEGTAALARALATNRSLNGVCLATGGPKDGEQVLGVATALPTTRFPPVSFVGGGGAQLYLDGNSIGDAGITALVRALAANDTLRWVCDGAVQRCRLRVHVHVMPSLALHR